MEDDSPVPPKMCLHLKLLHVVMNDRFKDANSLMREQSSKGMNERHFGPKQTFNESENRLGFHDFSGQIFDIASRAKQTKTNKNTIPEF